MSWTDDRVELLKKLWGEGRTAAEIASELGGVTRNAVIGKAHRLKLSGRASPIQQNVRKKTPANHSVSPSPAQDNKQPLKKEAPVVEVGSQPAKGVKMLSMLDLAPSQCRWPYGDPREKNFGFCGCKRRDSNVPYCEEHAEMAYQISARSRTLNADDLEREEKARAEKMALNS